MNFNNIVIEISLMQTLINWVGFNLLGLSLNSGWWRA